MKKFDWDDPLREEVKNKWIELFAVIETLKYVDFFTFSTGLSELYVFADANVNAYGAVAYLLWPSRDIPKVHSGLANARVASLRRRTIPRQPSCSHDTPRH